MSKAKEILFWVLFSIGSIIILGIAVFAIINPGLTHTEVLLKTKELGFLALMIGVILKVLNRK